MATMRIKGSGEVTAVIVSGCPDVTTLPEWPQATKVIVVGCPGVRDECIRRGYVYYD